MKKICGDGIKVSLKELSNLYSKNRRMVLIGAVVLLAVVLFFFATQFAVVTKDYKATFTVEDTVTKAKVKFKVRVERTGKYLIDIATVSLKHMDTGEFTKEKSMTGRGDIATFDGSFTVSANGFYKIQATITGEIPYEDTKTVALLSRTFTVNAPELADREVVEEYIEPVEPAEISGFELFIPLIAIPILIKEKRKRCDKN